MRVPRWLRPAVHRKMFWRGNDPEIFRIVSLQSGDERHAHASGEKRILAIGFLARGPSADRGRC